MLNKIKSWVWNIISSSLPFEYDLEVLRKILLINILTSLGCCFILLLSIIACFQQDYILALSNFIIFFILFSLFLYLRKTKNYDIASIAGTIITGIFFSFLFAYGGVNKTAYIWSFTYPLISLYLLGTRLGTFMSTLLFGMIILIFTFGSQFSFVATYNMDLKIRFIPAYITIYSFAIVVEKVRKIIQNRLTASNVNLEKANLEKDRLIDELHDKMNEIQTLQGILPMCSKCKKIRDDKGYWEQVEKYVQDRSEAQFSHGICPECAKEIYPEFTKK